MSSNGAASEREGLWPLFLRFLKFGALAWGGPAAAPAGAMVLGVAQRDGRELPGAVRGEQALRLQQSQHPITVGGELSGGEHRVDPRHDQLQPAGRRVHVDGGADAHLDVVRELGPDDLHCHRAADRRLPRSVDDGGVVDADAFERDTLQRIGAPTEVAMRHRLPHFNHLFTSDSYSAGYYSYLWSEVMDADTREAFVEAGWFGLPQEDVFFLQQGMGPSFDFEGRLILERPDRIFENPGGQGGGDRHRCPRLLADRAAGHVEERHRVALGDETLSALGEHCEGRGDRGSLSSSNARLR